MNPRVSIILFCIFHLFYVFSIKDLFITCLTRLLMGHISANVFMSNYFNPVWIKDLKDRALKGKKRY